jgi:DNA adenine methylase
MGGKRRLARHLLPLLAECEHSCYVEPFCGAAALFFLREHRTKVEVLNDIHGELINLYRVVQHHLDEFVRHFRWALSSRQLFEWAQMTEPETLTDVQRAARFFYLQKLAFGGKVVGQTFGTATTSPARLNLLRMEEDLSEVHLRLNGVFVERRPWRACVEQYDRAHTLFFMDPPYWKTAGYGSSFGLDEYVHMAELMATMQGRGIVTVNDHPDMRRVFAGLKMQRVGITYTVQADAKKRVPTGELIIQSWGKGRGRKTA